MQRHLFSERLWIVINSLQLFLTITLSGDSVYKILTMFKLRRNEKVKENSSWNKLVYEGVETHRAHELPNSSQSDPLEARFFPPVRLRVVASGV
jgi:hypothetical protein